MRTIVRCGPAALVLSLGLACGAPTPDVHWRVVPTGSDALLLGICVLNDGVCVIVGGGREDDPAVILRSEDAGASWNRVEVGVQARLYAVHFPTSLVGYAVGLRGTVLKTTDGGKTWALKNSETKVWLATVFFLTVDRGFVAGSDEVLETADGGEHWRSLRDELPELPRDTWIRDLTFVNPNTGFLVGDGGLALKTDDGGATWISLETGTQTWLRAISFLDEGVGFVAGAQGLLLATHDGGASWERRPHPGGKLNDVAFLDAQVGFTTTMEGDLHRTDDGGRTWSAVYRDAPGALTGISRPSPLGLFVVGEHGLVLHRGGS